MKRTILAIVLLGICINAYAAYTDGDWEFEAISEDGKTARITRYSGASSHVRIPHSLFRSDTKENYTIIEIGRYVFNGNASLESIALPATVKTIGTGAFQKCPKLRGHVSLNNITSIYSQAFYYCTNITSVSLNHLRYIDYEAFSGCKNMSCELELPEIKTIGLRAFSGSGITQLRISSSLSKIGPGAFSSCDQLRYAEIDGDGNCVLGDDGYYRGVFSSCKSLEICKIGDGVASACSSTFFNSANLREVYFGKQITSVGGFDRAPNLEICSAPSATYIGNNAFKGCSVLTNCIDFTKVKIIGQYAFYGCSALSGTVSLDNATSIGSCAFSKSGIEYLKTSTTLKTMGSSAFMNCKSLKQATLSGTDLVLSEYNSDGVFAGCTALRKVSFDAGIVKVGKYSFGNTACEYFFKGKVPETGERPFGGSGSNARYGYYTAEYAAEWEKVIPSSGVWNYLIMKKAKQPKLEITSVDWVNGSIKLDWSKGEDGEDVNWPCTLYRGTSPSFAEAEAVEGAIGTTETSFTDAGFLSTAPHTAPLYYWVKPDNSEMPYAPSLPVVTRRRYGLFVGMNAPYEGNWREYYPSMQESTLAVADLFEGFGFEFDDIKWNITGEMLSREIDRMAYKCKKGDICLMWINTHGGADPTVEGTYSSFLAMHKKNDLYTAFQMAMDLAGFMDSVAVIPILFACHAEGMTDFSTHFDAQSFCEKSLCQCTANVSPITACAVSQTSPAANGGSDQHDSFPLFLINSAEMSEDKNGDGFLSLGEMSDYIYEQQLLFTPYATLVTSNRALLDKLIMKKYGAFQQGSAPDPVTWIGIEYSSPDSDSNENMITIRWSASAQAKWYSVQCPALQLSELIYRAQLGIKRKVLAKGYGKDLIFTVYAGNKYGRSAGREISYKASEAIFDCNATSDRADGILVSWNFIGIETVGVSIYRRIKELSDSWRLLAVVPASDGQSYFDDAAIAGVNYAYEIVPLQNETGKSGTCDGYRQPEYKLAVNPRIVPVEAREKFYKLPIEANAKIETSVTGDFVTVLNFKDGTSLIHCAKNFSNSEREAKITFRLIGTDISETVTITQLGADDKRCEEKALSAFMSRKNIKSEARLSEDADGNGLPDLFDYAYQDNEEAAKESLCKIEMENGLPKISVPKQNPFTTKEVDVYVESSEDMVNWCRMEDASEPCNSADGRRVEHSPKVNENSSKTFFRAKADFR